MEFVLEHATLLPGLTLCRVPLESPRKAMLCPCRTLTATAVRRAAEVCHTALASKGARLAIGLGVWSEPQGYAFRVFCEMQTQQKVWLAGLSLNKHQHKTIFECTDLIKNV